MKDYWFWKLVVTYRAEFWVWRNHVTFLHALLTEINLTLELLFNSRNDFDCNLLNLKKMLAIDTIKQIKNLISVGE